MKKLLVMIGATVVASAILSLAAGAHDLAADFANPPRKYGVNCWWWWLNGNTDKDAIARELAAMKDKGFQGATIDEAEKNGLELGFTIQSGWNLGGPSVTPAHIAKQLVFTKTVLNGGHAAWYTKKFTLAKRAGMRYRVELGEVLDTGVATVRLNGKNLGTVWTKPFGVDVTEALADGENVLEVKVVNSWHNRVLGDQLQSGGKTYTQANIEIANRNGRKGKPSPSGLLGPVTVSAAPAAKVDANGKNAEQF